MTRRYYQPDLPPGGGLIQLTKDEAQHASRVMRVEVGDSLTLFDGLGHEADAEIVSVGRRDVSCQAGPASAVDREASIAVRLGIALPKPDRAKEMIERLTELGVASVTPIIGARTQRPPSPSLIGKLRRAVIESSKQCGRNRLMEVHEASTLSDFVACVPEHGSRWIAHPTGKLAVPFSADETGMLTALVGPEGGWSDEELRLAMDNEFRAVNLGSRILRIETAAVFVAATQCG